MSPFVLTVVEFQNGPKLHPTLPVTPFSVYLCLAESMHAFSVLIGASVMLCNYVAPSASADDLICSVHCLVWPSLSNANE